MNERRLHHLRKLKKKMKQHFDRVREMSDQEVTDRYAEEMRKVKMINRWTLQGKEKYGPARGRGLNLEEAYGPRPCGYPDTAMMNCCKRELERRGLPIPQVSLPE